MRNLTRGSVIVVACSWASAALGATLPLVSVAVLPGNQLSFQGFDPALGTLRCVRVQMGLLYDVTGEMFVIGFSGGAGSATICVGATCGIGHSDGTGFVAHAGTGSCVDITRTCSGSPIAFCSYPGILVSGNASGTGLVTHGGYLNGYIGAGLRGLNGGAAYAEQFGSATPGFSAGFNVSMFMATPSFGLVYVYTPINRCPGDVNSDGHIDFLDLNAVLGSFSDVGPCGLGDVNNDNVVDFLDLNEVLGFFGQACR